MTAQQLAAFAKANGGAAVAIALLLISNNKLEDRLEKVESKLYDCYTINMNASNESNEFPDRKEIMPKLAVLPEKKEHETEGSNDYHPN